MSNQYKNNHYVPQWYQRHFLPHNQENKELFYLNLKPKIAVDSDGISHILNPIHKTGFKYCFAEEDLYTTRFGKEESTKIEQMFFGKIDSNGKKAVDYFINFKHPSINQKAFNDLITYMSVQKLRTPKGLEWLSRQSGSSNQNEILNIMIYLKSLYCAIWTECVWLIADASQSETKFIVSDHPVTVYNRKCNPNSKYCSESNDPDISLNATQTIFPLSLDKVLILTNLSWVRNPYQSELKLRPNPIKLRPAMFKILDIQTLRLLKEAEVKEINFIIKKRAYSYIGAAKKEWLFPEEDVSTSNWNNFGNGYLLMPDPRSLDYSGEIMWGNDNGIVGSIDAYGRPAGHPDFNKEIDTKEEFQTFYKFKGEFAHLYGPYRRGRAFRIGQLDPEKETEEQYKYHLSLYKSK